MRQKKIFFLCCIVFCVYDFSSLAQNKTLDSLLKVVKTSKSDTNCVKNLLKISNIYINNHNFLDAKKYAQIALNTSEIINNKKSISDAFVSYGLIYYVSLNYDSALCMFKNALHYVDSIHNVKSTASIFNNIGSVYLKKSDYLLALNNFYKSLEKFELIKDVNSIAKVYMSIGSAFQEQKNE